MFHLTSVYFVCILSFYLLLLFLGLLLLLLLLLESKSDIQLHQIVLHSTLKIISCSQLTANPQEWMNTHTQKRKTLVSSAYLQYIFLYIRLQLVFLLLRLWSGCWAINTVKDSTRRHEWASFKANLPGAHIPQESGKFPVSCVQEVSNDCSSSFWDIVGGGRK